MTTDIPKEQFYATCKEAAETNGIKMMMHSKECDEFTKTHNGCKGCTYEIACSKYVALLLTSFEPNPSDHIERILKANDTDTIKKIDFMFCDYDNDSEDRYDNDSFIN